MAGALLVAAALPYTSEAHCWGGRQENRVTAKNQDQNRLRLRDGSCVYSTRLKMDSGNKRGKGYGPGNCSGNAGAGPRNGTGYGVPY